MKRSMFVLFALCGLLWPSESVAQDPVETPGTDPNLRLRYGSSSGGVNPDTVFVDWSTMYAKPQDPASDLETGIPATAYQFILYDTQGVSEFNVTLTSLTLGSSSSNLFYEGQYAQVRRDTLLLPNTFDPSLDYVGTITPAFVDAAYEIAAQYSSSLVPTDLPLAAFLSFDTAFVREDAGATIIEVIAQLSGRRTAFRDIHVTPTIRIGNNGLNYFFYLDAPTFVIKEGERSAIGQMTLTPISNDFRGYPEFGEEDDTAFKIAIGA